MPKPMHEGRGDTADVIMFIAVAGLYFYGLLGLCLGWWKL